MYFAFLQYELVNTCHSLTLLHAHTLTLSLTHTNTLDVKSQTNHWHNNIALVRGNYLECAFRLYSLLSAPPRALCSNAKAQWDTGCSYRELITVQGVYPVGYEHAHTHARTHIHTNYLLHTNTNTQLFCCVMTGGPSLYVPVSSFISDQSHSPKHCDYSWSRGENSDKLCH